MFGRTIACLLVAFFCSSSAFAWPLGIPYPADYPPGGVGVELHHENGEGYSEWITAGGLLKIRYNWADHNQEIAEGGMYFSLSYKLRKRTVYVLENGNWKFSSISGYQVDNQLSSSAAQNSDRHVNQSNYGLGSIYVNNILEVFEGTAQKAGSKHVETAGTGRSFTVRSTSYPFGPSGCPVSTIEDAIITFSSTPDIWSLDRKYYRRSNNIVLQHIDTLSNGDFIIAPTIPVVSLTTSLPHIINFSSLFAQTDPSHHRNNWLADVIAPWTFPGEIW